MSERREDFDVEHAQTPLWRRPRVVGLSIVFVGFLIWIFTHHGSPPAAPEVAQNAGIAVHETYEPPPKDPSPPPPPPPAPQLPPNPFVKPQAPVREAAMVSYPVKVTPWPVAKTEPEREPDRTGVKFATSTLPGLKASPAIDDTYQLMPGLLPCVLDVAIDSNLPGPLMCHLPGPVYSTKGVKLMDAMTQVIGKYESLKQNGVNRLEAVSTYAHVPVGQAGQIWVPLTGQPLADDLGRTGLSGTIDHRYLERFGGAILLDLSQSALQIIQADVAKGGSTYLNVNGTDQLANQILQSTINLPPILTKQQGSMIAIWLTEPVDFSDSYSVQATR